jgi:hypothetical protein
MTKTLAGIGFPLMVVLGVTAPLSAQVPFEIRTNTAGFEQSQTIASPDGVFRGVASDGNLIVAVGNGGVLHTFIRTPGGFVDTHPIYEASPLAGRALAIHNGRAIVGFEYGAGIFRYTASGWELEHYVVRSDPRFGTDVDITDDYAIVGGTSSSTILRRGGSSWYEDADLTDPITSDRVVRVAISGQRAATHFPNGRGPSNFGPIRIYERNQQGWAESAVFSSGILPGDMDLDDTLFVEQPDWEILATIRTRDVTDPTVTAARALNGAYHVLGRISADEDRVGVSLRSFNPSSTTSQGVPGGAMVVNVGLEALFDARVTERDSAGIWRGVGDTVLARNTLVVITHPFDGQPAMLTVFEIPGGVGTTPSPSGTRTPPASQIVDNNLDVWTLGSGLETLRNGVHVSGLGTQYLWYQNTLYVLGVDEQWWRWTGDGWSPHGPADPASGAGLTPSPSGTRTPPAPQIVDQELAVWTLGSSLETLRNGAHAGSGLGTQFLYYEHVVYVLGVDDQWWRWSGAGWFPHGPADPSSGSGGPTPSPSGTRGTAITDHNLAVWTIGPSLQTLRDGAHPGGLGTEYLWYQGVLYVFGIDSQWWMWTGSGWTFFGADPAS